MGTGNVSGWVSLGAVLAGLSVATGAIAAHGIDAHLAGHYQGQTREIAGASMPAAQKYLADFKTASQYQMAHSLGLIVVGILSTRRRSCMLTAAGWLFLTGICLFCGALYGLSLFAHQMDEGARHTVGLTAATGGTLFIVGWGLLAAGACSCRGVSEAPSSGSAASP